MAIGYEDMSCNDAYNYFNGCWAFKVLPSGAVQAFTLDMSYEGDCGGELAHNWTYVATDRAGNDVHVTGEELFNTNDWITHRFQLGYLPMSQTRIIRLDAEPVSRRMIKGLTHNHCTSLPIVNGSGQDLLIRRCQGSVRSMAVPAAIAKVLALGTPPVMRSRVSQGNSFVRARRSVEAYMDSESWLVHVPDFRIGLVKWRNVRDRAYILYNGQHIGDLHSSSAGPQAYLIRANTSKRAVNKHIDKTRENLARRLLTPNVSWAKS